MIIIRSIALFVLALSLGAIIAVSLKQETSEEKAALLRLSGIEQRDPISLRFDKIRELVNAHSVYNGKGTVGNTANLADPTIALYRYAAGVSKSPPRLTSAERASVFARLLKIAGYKARTITLLQPQSPYFAHTLVEVYNRRTRQWELQDQDYNVFYTFNGSTQRVSLADMLSQPIENFIPCHTDGGCNWLMASPEKLNVVNLKPYFGAAIIAEEERTTLALNASRFDLGKSGLCNRHHALCKGKKIYYE